MIEKKPRVSSLLLAPLLNGIILGAIVGGCMVYIAVQHNPQGEFYDYDLHALELETTVPVFLSWLIPVALVVFVVESLISLAWRWMRRPAR